MAAPGHHAAFLARLKRIAGDSATALGVRRFGQESLAAGRSNDFGQPRAAGTFRLFPHGAEALGPAELCAR